MPATLPRSTPIALSDAQLSAYTAFAHALADAAGAAIRPHFRARLAVDDKGGTRGYDPVTVADRAAEDAMCRLITATHPEHGVFGEEHGARAGSAGLTWVLDPIDGTRAFITGMPLWGTLIALYDGSRPVLGVMDQPYTGERFVGSRFGAELVTREGRTALAVRPCAGLGEAVLYSTHPDLFVPGAERAAFDALCKQVRMTRYSGDCYAYCMLAAGHLDLIVESGLQPYDVAALIPIIEAAGGHITDWHGGPCHDGGRVLAAGDARVHAQALAALAQVP